MGGALSEQGGQKMADGLQTESRGNETSRIFNAGRMGMKPARFQCKQIGNETSRLFNASRIRMKPAGYSMQAE